MVVETDKRVGREERSFLAFPSLVAVVDVMPQRQRVYRARLSKYREAWGGRKRIVFVIEKQEVFTLD